MVNCVIELLQTRDRVPRSQWLMWISHQIFVLCWRRHALRSTAGRRRGWHEHWTTQQTRRGTRTLEQHFGGIKVVKRPVECLLLFTTLSLPATSLQRHQQQRRRRRNGIAPPLQCLIEFAAEQLYFNRLASQVICR